MVYHGEVNIAGIQLHVDLLVNESLALLAEVLPDGGHPDAGGLRSKVKTLNLQRKNKFTIKL